MRARPEGFEPPTVGLEIRCCDSATSDAGKGSGDRENVVAGLVAGFLAEPAPGRRSDALRESALNDPELQRIVDAWPKLPEPLRAALLAIVQTAGG